MTTQKTGPMTRVADWLGRRMPTLEQMAGNRYIPKSALRSELWRFTRRSVPRGVALGIIIGIIVPFAQTIFAAVLSLPVRANVPLAALMTFITNPFTTPLLWAFSYKVGKALLRADAMMPQGPIDSLFNVTDISSFLHWVTDEGRILVFGLIVVAVIAGALGYLLASFAWRWRIVRRRRHRAAR